MVTLREEIAEFEKLSSQTYQYDSYDAGETLSAQKGMKIIKRLQKVIEIQSVALKTLEEMVAMLEDALRGSGFNFKRHLEIVEDEE